MRNSARRLILVLGSIAIASSAGHARPVRSIWLERDLKECEIVVVGTVTDVEPGAIETRIVPNCWVAGKPVEETLEARMISYRAELVLKGPARERKTYKFRHYRFVRSNSMFWSRQYFSCEAGETLLLFLKRQEDGAYEYVAPEEEPVAFDAGEMRKLRELPREAALVDGVIDVLLVRLEAGPPSVASLIWMLDHSPTFKKRAGDEIFRDRAVEALIRVTEMSRDGADVTAAYTLLGRLNETRVIRRIVEFACRKGKTWEHKTGAINWLQGFPAREQVKALEGIAEKAHDISAAGYARQRLGRLRWRAEEEERRARQRAAKAEEPRKAEESPYSRKVTFELVDTPLGEAVVFLRRSAKTNIVVKDGRDTKVSLRVNDIPVAEALWQLAQKAKLDVGLEGGRIVLARRGSLGEAKARFEALLPATQESEQSLKKRLSRGVSFEFVETPVAEALSFLMTLTKTNITLDDGREASVNFKASDMRLCDALWWIAHMAGLDVGLARSTVALAERGTLGEGVVRFEALLPSAREAAKELEKIEAVLARKVGFDFVDIRLDQAVAFFETLTKLNMVLDRGAVERKVTLAVKDLAIRDAILKTARAAGLDAGFVHGAIFISTPEELKRLGARPLGE